MAPEPSGNPRRRPARATALVHGFPYERTPTSIRARKRRDRHAFAPKDGQCSRLDARSNGGRDSSWRARSFRAPRRSILRPASVLRAVRQRVERRRPPGWEVRVATRRLARARRQVDHRPPVVAARAAPVAAPAREVPAGRAAMPAPAAPARRPTARFHPIHRPTRATAHSQARSRPIAAAATPRAAKSIRVTPISTSSKERSTI